MALALVCAAAAALAAPAAADARATFYVAPSGTDSTTCGSSTSPCRTVGQGVSQGWRYTQGGGDPGTEVVVQVAPGNYPESVSVPVVPSGQSLTITGAGADSTAIDGKVGTDLNVMGGTVNVSGLTLSGNAGHFGGGILNSPAGVLSLSDVTVSGNSADAGGGGVYNAGTLTLRDSTVSGNTTNGDGGGIYNGGTLTVDGSTVSANAAAGDPRAPVPGGGGIYDDGGGTVLLTDSTIAGNTTTGTAGGAGIDNNGGDVTVSGSTVSGNDIANDNGPQANDGGTVTIGASILSASSCVGALGDPDKAKSKQGGVADAGFNVVSDGSCQLGASSAVSNVSGIGLGTLAANGSPGPQTMAIDTTSSAHSFVPVSSGLCTATDERGVGRPGESGSRTCDAGSYEIGILAVTVSGSQTYGDAAPALTLDTSGVAQGLSVSGKVSCDQVRPQTSNPGAPRPPSVPLDPGLPVGTYSLASCHGVSLSGVNAGEYTLELDAGSFTVTPASLTIVASDGSTPYGAAPPVPTATYQGFVNGESANTALTTPPSCSTAATASSPVGTYRTSCTGAAAANYTIAYRPGTMTVTPAPINLHVAAVSLVGSLVTGRVSFSATVTSGATGRPLAGGKVTFTVRTVLHTSFGCTATSGSDGSARCTSGDVLGLLFAINSDCTGTIAAAGNYAAATDTAPIRLL